jgi:hypothetical protein
MRRDSQARAGAIAASSAALYVAAASTPAVAAVPAITISPQWLFGLAFGGPTLLLALGFGAALLVDILQRSKDAP